MAIKKRGGEKGEGGSYTHGFTKQYVGFRRRRIMMMIIMFLFSFFKREKRRKGERGKERKNELRRF